MLSLAKLSIRRPKSALAVWLIIGAVLSAIGFGVSSTLSPSVTVVPGTQSSRAQELGNAKFGPSQLVPILLEGPKTELNRQGPALVSALAKRAHTRVLSAWDAGTASAGLRPKPTAAMIVVSVDRSEKDAVKYDEPQIENLVAHKISSPVRSYITGQPSIDRAVRDAAISNLREGELIAVGILFVLLLLGLRAPVAALLVTAVAGISMLAGFGETALLGHVMTLDPVGAALGTMTGLALAAAFSLLILDRFHREELPEGRHPRDAAIAALRELETTGRAVLIGGSGVVLALALSAIIGPTQLMVSLGAGMLTCALFATGGAVVVMPAAFVLLGRRVDAFSFPAPAPLASAWSALVSGGNWVTRHAVYAGFAATVLLALLAVPALALKSGQPSPTQLPSDSNARIAFQEVSRVMGPGWPTPFNVIVVAKDRPVTTPATLASIYSFERQIAKNKTVASVTGPGAINSTSNQLKSFEPGLKNSVKLSDQSKKDLLTLANGLGQAGAGSAQLQAGLASASSGAGQLQSGGGQAHSGSSQLHAGLAQAQSGSKQLMAGLNQALTGAVALKNGSSQVLNGSAQLTNGLAQAQNGAKPVVPGLNALASAAAATKTNVDNALGQLNAMTTGKSDPNYAAVHDALTKASGAAAFTSGAASAAAQQAPALVNGINQLHAGAAQLQAGIEQLHAGNAQLANGINQLATAGSALPKGLNQLTAGAAALEIGLGQLADGAGQLATGLSGGVAPAGQLTTGLGTMQAAVVKSRGQIPSTAQLKQLFAESPGMFNSGYFVLAAVEGATAANRNAASFTINLLQGGTAGQIMVVSKYPSNDARTTALGTALASAGQNFAKKNNLEAALGGPAGNLGDLTSVTNSRIWFNVAAIALALALALAVALRAVLLPLAAAALGLLVSAATFGALKLLYGGSDPLLGGPGYLVPMTIIGIFVIAFSVSMMYAAVLLLRSREAYTAEGGVRHSVRVGLRETAAAATGAGVVMAAVLIPFATTDFGFVEPFAVGVAIAILLDVLIMRPVLLPAAVAVLGRYGWWPTKSPTRGQPEPLAKPRRRLHRPHFPHHRPGAAH